MKKAFLLLSVLVLSACLKKEIPVPKRLGDGVMSDAIDMGNDYIYQVYFDLSENKVVEKNNKKIWDIAFESGLGGNHVITNTSKYMFAYRTDKTDLAAVIDHNNCTVSNHYYDMPSGNLDSTAIGDWTDGFVRILDLGTDASGNQLGWYKIKIDTVKDNYFYFTYAPVSATTFTTDSVQKQTDYNFVYYSLKNKSKVDVAPKTKDWDLVFTQYIKHLTEPLVMDYLVTGCILNRYDTKALLVTDKKFDAIDLAYANSLNLKATGDEIGYDWKDIGLEEVMNGGTAEYTIYPNKSYIIQDQDGVYYKLRFTNFYSKTGQKGTPTFEYKELK